MRHRITSLLILTLLAGAYLAAPAVVSACPNCKMANSAPEDADADEKASIEARPKAYMYSILFMMSMPATLITVFGFSCWRMVKKAEASQVTALDSSKDFPAVLD